MREERGRRRLARAAPPFILNHGGGAEAKMYGSRVPYRDRRAGEERRACFEYIDIGYVGVEGYVGGELEMLQGKGG